MTDPTSEQLRAAGLAEGEGWWRDAGEATGAVTSAIGILVGWIDIAWAGPGAPEPWLRDVVHVTPAAVATDLRPVLARAELRHTAARRHCRLCHGLFVPGYMHSRDVCRACAG
jgi:hypothetical protein